MSIFGDNSPAHESANNGPLNVAGVQRVTWSVNGDTRLLRGETQGVITEKYRLLAHRVRRARAARPIQTLLVTSSIPGEGKTTVAANLASVLARNGSRVLLLDADLRAPDLSKALGLTSSLPGLSEVLAGELSFEQALRCVNPLGLYLLSAGRPVDNPVPWLEGAVFKNVLASARQAFEWVIIDSPPLTPVVDAHCLAAMVDGILLVVRWGFTPREELDQAVGTLAGLPLLGMVLNAFDEPRKKVYYSYYSRSAPVLSLPAAPDDVEPQPRT